MHRNKYQREYYHKNREDYRKKRREYYHKNKESFHKKNALYRKNNPEKIKAQKRRYKERHLEEIKEYKKNYGRNYRLRPGKKERINELNRKNLIRTKKIVYDYYGNCCACCGERQPEFLAIDHIANGKGHPAKQTNHGLGFYSWIVKNNFPKTLQILCHNCNMAKSIYGICPHQKKKLLFHQVSYEYKSDWGKDVVVNG